MVKIGIFECILTVFLSEKGLKTGFFYGILCVFLVDLTVFLGYLRHKKREKVRKINGEKVARQLLFTLPDKENSFLKDKLKTTLRGEKEAYYFDLTTEKIKWEYLQELLRKLSGKQLSLGERVNVEAVENRIRELTNKDRLSDEEVKEMGDGFLSIVKLAGKYAV